MSSKENEKDFRKILPELRIRHKKEIPFESKIEVFRGKEGVNAILKLILKDKKDYYMLGGGEQCCGKEFGLLMEIFLKQAEKLGLKGKLLERKEADFFVGKNEDYRFLSKEFFSSTTTAICGNKLVIFVWTKPYYAILIENKEVVKSNISVFNNLWKMSKIPSKKDRYKRLLKY